MSDRTKWAELQLRCRRRLAHFKGSDADETLEALASGALVIPKWHPIESAPRDGTMVLVNQEEVEGGVTIAFLDRLGVRSAWDGKLFRDLVKPPTHWMPLPNPPVKSNAQVHLRRAARSDASPSGGTAG